MRNNTATTIVTTIGPANDDQSGVVNIRWRGNDGYYIVGTVGVIRLDEGVVRR